MLKAVRVEAVRPGAALAAARVQERQVVECLARADLCQVPAKGHPCQGNPQRGREATPAHKEDQPVKACPVKKAHHQWILPGSQGPAPPDNQQAWDRVLPKGLARLEHRPDRAATDFSFSSV
jgi:hypothetical protein